MNLNPEQAQAAMEGTGGPLFNEYKAQLPRLRTLEVLPPQRAWIEPYGVGVRAVIVDRDHESTETVGTSAVEYHVHWAASVDTSTEAGVAAGFTRSILLAPAIPAPGRAGAVATATFNDPKYLEGYFYFTGVAADGKRSEPTAPVRVGGGAGGGIPGDVQHFRCSESGEQDGQGTLSKISYVFEQPDSVENVARQQFYYLNYPALNQVSEGESVQRTAGAGGSQTGDIRLPVARRFGAGTISITGTAVTGVGTNLLAIAAVAGGDYLEVFGTRARIASVASTTSMTLSSAWTGPAVAGVESGTWLVIGSVTIFCVSVGFDGSRRSDYENAPSQTVLLDGELSPPLAPGSVFVTPVATGVRITWSQVAGTDLRGYNIYRSDGSTPDAGMASQPPIPSAGTILISPPSGQNANIADGAAFMQFDDTNFTAYELETNAIFTWYVTTTNVRGDESEGVDVFATCRAVLPNEIDPVLSTLVDPKNYIYNSFIDGTTANEVLADDTSQDVHTGSDASNLPGRPFGAASGQLDGTGRFRGYSRLESGDGGTGATGIVTFEGGEVNFPPPDTGVHYVWGECGAWDHLTPVFRKIERGATFILSCYLNHTGVTPDGLFSIWLEQMNNGTSVADCFIRNRDSSGAIVGVAGKLFIDASVITSTSTRFWAVFQTDADVANSKQLRYNFAWDNGTVGAIRMKKIALQRGEIPPPWTSDMGDTTVAVPNPTNPAEPTGDRRRERFGDVYLVAT